MIESNDIDGRCTEIRHLMSSGKVSNSLKRLMDFVSDFSDDKSHRNEVTVISANFRSVEQAERRRSLSFQEAQKERNDLLYQALSLLDEVVETLYPEAV